MMSWKKVLVNGMIFVVVVFVYFLVCEQIVRVEMFGANAWSPQLMDNIKFSRTYQFTDGGCYLSGNYNDYLKGAHMKTNYLGLRENKEYDFNKPNNTFRIAVVGDSTTTGIGVEIQDVYHNIFERKLNEGNSEIFYEVVSFSKGGIQNTHKHHCYFLRLNDALHFAPDVTIIQLFRSYDDFLSNASNIQKLEVLDNYTQIIIMVFNQDDNYPLQHYYNLTTLPILSLNVTHTDKDDIFPADWHPNEKIHQEYADSLYAYFIENEKEIYQEAKLLREPENLSAIRIPEETYARGVRTGFWESYYVEKILKRYKQMSTELASEFKIESK